MTQASGIDVSEYQGTTPGLAGLDFLIARASIGFAHDARYAQHIAKARASGLVTGAYHFADSRLSIAQQVQTFVDAAGDVDLYAVDVEGANSLSVAQINAFVNAMHGHGKLCGLYHSTSGYPTTAADWAWVAQWTTVPPTRHWDFWQYRGSPLDLDRYHGTRAELDAWLHPTGPDTSTGGTMDWRIVTAVPGTFTATAPGAGWIEPDTFAVHPMAVGAAVYVMAQVHIGGRWDKPGYLGSDATVHGRLVLAGDGTFVPTVPDCTAEIAATAVVRHELDTANSRIRQAITALGGTI